MKYLTPEILRMISSVEGKTVRQTETKSVSGGCINQAFEFVTSIGSFFIKINSSIDYPQMFNAEESGLRILASAKTIRIPQVIGTAEKGSQAFLVMEFIRAGQKRRDYWIDFAQKLAALHQNTNSFFGLNQNNYIGSLPQSNTKHDSWAEFMITQRFEPLVHQAMNRGLADIDLAGLFDKLYSKLKNLVTEEKPSLLHGDLWHGNVITDENGEVCLIDPAVYYGHREVDIAFSTLFGAFPAEFYQAYDEVFPLEKDWRQRIELFNIYPLLVHLLLFGKSYYPEVKSSVKRYL